MKPTKSFGLINEVLYLIFFISIACSFRIVSSITIVLILLTGLIQGKILHQPLSQNLKNPFLSACSLLFLFYAATLFYSSNENENWIDIKGKIGLVIVPFAICISGFINHTIKKKLSSWFISVVAAVSLYCIAITGWTYFQSGDSSVFFYHALVQPVAGHAIYFSVLVFIALVFSIEYLAKSNFIVNKSFHFACIVFLSIFLFLLSSKLVMAFYFLYLVVFLMSLIKKRPSYRKLIIVALILFIAVTVISLVTPNPVSRRFADAMKGNLEVLKMEKFDPGMYFNGVQFRLLEWRFTAEILNENNGWMTGVGPANAQRLLDQKYTSLKMYIGDPARGDHGLLSYNTHNQFLETLLKTGVFGLMALLFACIILIRMAWQKKKRLVNFIIALLITWLFTESVLERQYGIIIFTFFPLFIWSEEKQAA